MRTVATAVGVTCTQCLDAVRWTLLFPTPSLQVVSRTPTVVSPLEDDYPIPIYAQWVCAVIVPND